MTKCSTSCWCRAPRAASSADLPGMAWSGWERSVSRGRPFGRMAGHATMPRTHRLACSSCAAALGPKSVDEPTASRLLGEPGGGALLVSHMVSRVCCLPATIPCSVASRRCCPRRLRCPVLAWSDEVPAVLSHVVGAGAPGPLSWGDGRRACQSVRVCSDQRRRMDGRPDEPAIQPVVTPPIKCRPHLTLHS